MTWQYYDSICGGQYSLVSSNVALTEGESLHKLHPSVIRTCDALRLLKNCTSVDVGVSRTAHEIAFDKAKQKTLFITWPKGQIFQN
jgi:hypothetical protein